MSMMSNSLNNDNQHRIINSFGDSIESLPVDERFDQQPRDQEFINSIFTPIPEPDISYGIKIAAFAGVIYTLITNTPMIDEYFKKTFENPTTRYVLQVCVVAGASYLFSRSL